MIDNHDTKLNGKLNFRHRHFLMLKLLYVTDCVLNLRIHIGFHRFSNILPYTDSATKMNITHTNTLSSHFV